MKADEATFEALCCRLDKKSYIPEKSDFLLWVTWAHCETLVLQLCPPRFDLINEIISTSGAALPLRSSQNSDLLAGSVLSCSRRTSINGHVRCQSALERDAKSQPAHSRNINHYEHWRIWLSPSPILWGWKQKSAGSCLGGAAGVLSRVDVRTAEPQLAALCTEHARLSSEPWCQATRRRRCEGKQSTELLLHL